MGPITVGCGLMGSAGYDWYSKGLMGDEICKGLMSYQISSFDFVFYNIRIGD